MTNDHSWAGEKGNRDPEIGKASAATSATSAAATAPAPTPATAPATVTDAANDARADTHVTMDKEKDGAWVRGCVGAWVRGCVGAWRMYVAD